MTPSPPHPHSYFISRYDTRSGTAVRRAVAGGDTTAAIAPAAAPPRQHIARPTRLPHAARGS